MPDIPEKMLTGRSCEYPIEVLTSKTVVPAATEERRLLIWVLPPWQRPEVWETERKKRFIEGIFLGLGTGYYVVHEPDWDSAGSKPMAGWLIDGQQRLSAIRDFVYNGLEIFDGVRYDAMDEFVRRRRFSNVVFPSIEVKYQEDERHLRDLYLRLNFGGVSHTQEDRERMNQPLMKDQVDRPRN